MRTVLESSDDDSSSLLPLVVLGKKWQAVGPFPSGMREHPFAYSPLSASIGDDDDDADIAFARLPYDFHQTWPSEMGVGGRVGWTEFQSDSQGWVAVKYPHIEWKQLRADHGWAALQFQSFLRTSLSIPSLNNCSETPLLIDLIQGTEFALIDIQEPTTPTVWYAGDVYDFGGTSAGRRGKGDEELSHFARSLAVKPGQYTLLVRAMYEIRMFGDPHNSPPVIRLRVRVKVDDGKVELGKGQNIMPDLVDGWFMGSWMSIPLRIPEGCDDVSVIATDTATHQIGLEMSRIVTVRSGQTRPVSIKIYQHGPIEKSLLALKLIFILKSEGPDRTESMSIPLKHHTLTQPGPFKMTHAISDGHMPALVSYAMVVPPPFINPTTLQPPPVILALHGAGVEASSPSWTKAMPRRQDTWAILPTGKTEWGEDWHGGSMTDSWSARDSLQENLTKIGVKVSDQTILLGHSNGGQGAWHLAARYPDRVIGVIPAAGYLKIQDYVPYLHLTSNHYADPALMGILMSALTPYNNDLYASNLSNIPILAIHGSQDDNVPPRHSREHVALISAWEGKNDIKLLEVPGRGHWWNEIFALPEVGQFLDTLRPRKADEERKEGFTLTTANPDETGSRAGIRIVELQTPGRLARLDVNARQWRNGSRIPELDLRSTNVKRIEITSGRGAGVFVKSKQTWEEEMSPYQPRAYGPMIRLLASTAPIAFVIGRDVQHLNIAKRLAHDLYVYQRQDSEILSDGDALLRIAQDELLGSIVSIGRPEDNRLTDYLLKQCKIPLAFPTKSVMTLNDELVYEAGAGIITLHPHPTHRRALACIIAGNDALGLELAARLFPIRTGVPIPDWVIIGRQATWKAAGGFIGAG
ncbi:hypothetical protein M231_04482 [Tremella mesenterica]|uniref:Peptidase S9 prolyl oligopeptidase catalytic domain-containing protein n=1 Tax=Tremella mesenterica TaxID=5217 RepID=A0A4Q1BKN7_TREME|nr:hypothetical protein M231_04482 [Tremella mesenterica]